MYNVKLLFLIFIMIFIESCTLFHMQKLTVEQGNIITDVQLAKLHRGMSINQVSNILGINLVNEVIETHGSHQQVVYIHTSHILGEKLSKKLIIINFNYNKLSGVQLLS